MSSDKDGELFYLRDKVKRLTKLNAELRRELENKEQPKVSQQGWGYSD